MYTSQPNPNSISRRFWRLWQTLQTRRGLLSGVLIIGALLAFELFNFTTTDFALTDFLGDVAFFGVRWATILALAFCGMDFAGIARLFTPEKGVENGHDKMEVWYLLGAWFLAAAMNALLTWWGVSLALLDHQDLGNEILSRDQLLAVVPVFVAALVVLIRVLIIGTFSIAGNRLFTQAEESVATNARPAQAEPRMAPRPVMRAPIPDDWDSDFSQRPVEPRRVTPPVPVPARPVPPPLVAQPVRPAPKPTPKPMPAYADRNGDMNGRNASEAP